MGGLLEPQNPPFSERLPTELRLEVSPGIFRGNLRRCRVIGEEELRKNWKVLKNHQVFFEETSWTRIRLNPQLPQATPLSYPDPNNVAPLVHRHTLSFLSKTYCTLDLTSPTTCESSVQNVVGRFSFCGTFFFGLLRHKITLPKFI